jgi:very-short-patch-repair endonuclease
MANEQARHLRKNQTIAEEKLWLELRALKPRGYHFRRQAPIEGHIVDFACLAQRLVVEVDGTQRGEPVMLVNDSARDAHLRLRGYNVLRFSNSDVMDNRDGCLLEILAALGAAEKYE